jgi:hypothetical protein
MPDTSPKLMMTLPDTSGTGRVKINLSLTGVVHLLGSVIDGLVGKAQRHWKLW